MRSDILNMLRNARGEYLSGNEIAQKLGISRAAVWKHIRSLRQTGYDIESQSRNGYALTGEPDLLLPENILCGLNTKHIGQRIVHYDSVNSTNAVAKRLAAEGAAHGTVVVAEEQSSGRGRLERSFFSPPGGIWFSVILRPPFLPREAPKCTLMAAVAVAEAMKKLGMKPEIKWPNDLMYQGKKYVGILTEMSAETDRIQSVVIGIGINVNVEPEDFPPELRDTATSLSIMTGSQVPRVDLFRELLESMEKLYDLAYDEGFGPVFDLWKKYTVTLGREVDAIGVGKNETFTGKAVDIDEDGALLVDTGSEIRRVLAGDVSVRNHS